MLCYVHAKQHQLLCFVCQNDYSKVTKNWNYFRQHCIGRSAATKHSSASFFWSVEKCCEWTATRNIALYYIVALYYMIILTTYSCLYHISMTFPWPTCNSQTFPDKRSSCEYIIPWLGRHQTKETDPTTSCRCTCAQLFSLSPDNNEHCGWFLDEQEMLQNSTVFKVFSQKAALPLHMDGRINRIRQVASMCTPSNTYFLGPTLVHIPNSISIG